MEAIYYYTTYSLTLTALPFSEATGRFINCNDTHNGIYIYTYSRIYYRIQQLHTEEKSILLLLHIV